MYPSLPSVLACPRDHTSPLELLGSLIETDGEILSGGTSFPLVVSDIQSRAESRTFLRDRTKVTGSAQEAGGDRSQGCARRRPQLTMKVSRSLGRLLLCVCAPTRKHTKPGVRSPDTTQRALRIDRPA